MTHNRDYVAKNPFRDLASAAEREGKKMLALKYRISSAVLHEGKALQRGNADYAREAGADWEKAGDIASDIGKRRDALMFYNNSSALHSAAYLVGQQKYDREKIVGVQRKVDALHEKSEDLKETKYQGLLFKRRKRVFADDAEQMARRKIRDHEMLSNELLDIAINGNR